MLHVLHKSVIRNIPLSQNNKHFPPSNFNMRVKVVPHAAPMWFNYNVGQVSIEALF